MKVKANHTLASVLIGLCCVVVSGAAHAESNTALQNAALRNACKEQGGRFEQSWSYNDQGIRWGKILSCSTSAGYITCLGNVCRGGHWAPLKRSVTTDGRPADHSDVTRFPAEPAAFSAALAALSKN